MYNGTLNFGNDKDELDDFFADIDTAGAKAPNLSNIFGVGLEQPPEESNVTLKYVPPKATQVPQQKPGKSEWNLATAKVVTAFKLINQQNVAQGQLGLAMLKHATEGSVKILLYRDKENILSTLLLQSGTKVHIKQKYLQYHDDASALWSLYFANDNDRDTFVEELRSKCVVVDDNYSMEIKSAIDEKNEIDGAVFLFDEPVEKRDDLKTRMAKVGHQLPILDMHNPAPSEPDHDDVSSAISLDADPVVTAHLATYQNGGGLTSKPQNEVSKHPQLYPKPSTSKESDLVHVAVQPSSFFSNMMTPQNAAAMTLNNFVSEMRVQSTEGRMNMSKLETKIDRVLDKIDLLKLSGSKSMDRFASEEDRDEEILKLEEKVIELKKENRLLKAQVKDTENIKPAALVSDTQNAEVQKLKEEIKTKTGRITKLEADVAIKTVKCNELGYKMLESAEKLGNETKKVAELELKVKQCDELSAKVKELEAKLFEEQNKPKASAKGQNDAEASQLIRNIMNDFYQGFYQVVSGKTTFTQQEVLKLTAELIRNETKKALSRNS